MSERSDRVRDRSGDVLPDALAMVGARAARSSTFAGGGDWALRFAGSRHAKVVAVEQGTCWVRTGSADPVLLRAGDAYLLSGVDYVTASDPGLRPRDGASAAVDPARYEAGSGATTVRMVGSSFDFVHADGARLLLDGLPAARKLRPGIAATISLLAAEAATGGRAGEALRWHLSQSLYLQVFRSSALAGALREPGIGDALLALHERPAEPWTVARLATVAGLSRTVFATRFTALIGVPPMRYLLRRRIAGAETDLAAGRTVASVAGRWGYASESAFSAAYKRVTGHPPGARMQHPFRYD
ncbi:AraC family transcriptional regulator [Cryptosporangium sp. NPDC048952]|uniref:AraC family transcriptional regulator n=1 Tax=Cryptosporangium sp. NPDC048952 TaxID=3363961 RepID=UPI00371BA8EC